MIIDELRALEETCWKNPGLRPFQAAMESCELTMEDVLDAAARLDRFAAYFRITFPETCPRNGIVESPLWEIPAMKECLQLEHHTEIPGKLLLKMDSHLPVSGSIKARGGVYEVLKTAEDIALSNGLLSPGDDYSVFATEDFREYRGIENATHLVWATGGSMVPKDEMEKYYQTGKRQTV